MRSGALLGAIAAAVAAAHPFAIAGCGRDRAPEPVVVGRRVEPASAPASPSTSPSPAGAEAAPLEEAAARLLLAARFRAAGFRIVEDVRLRAGEVGLTADGFDPERRVGYEYVAAEERGVELDPSERALLARWPGATLLVVDAAGAGAVSALADRFLSGLARPDDRDRAAR